MSNFHFSLHGCSGVRTPYLPITRWTFYHLTTLPPLHDTVLTGWCIQVTPGGRLAWLVLNQWLHVVDLNANGMFHVPIGLLRSLLDRVGKA